MVIQVANIAAGFLLALPGLKEHGNRETFEKFESKAMPWLATIGLIELGIGLIALCERLGIFHLGLSLGSSFPQAVPAILIGLLLARKHFEKYAVLRNGIMRLEPHAFALGSIGMAVGVGSLLFGCILPLVCRVPF